MKKYMKKYIKGGYNPYSGLKTPSTIVYYGEINTNTGELDNPQPVAEFYKSSDAYEYAKMRNEYDAMNGGFFEVRTKRYF